MGFHCVFICAFFFASIIVQSFGELLVLRHLPTTRGATEKLTCISDDDDSAFIWNNAPRDFHPVKPKRHNVDECAIWDSSECRARWGNMGDWKVVESADRPMAPVFDFRWEGFKEYNSNTIIEDSEYQYVSKVNQSSGNVVFSVRGKKNVHVLLCEKKDQTKGRCLWIIIAGWMGAKSVLRYCPFGASVDKITPTEGSCWQIDVRVDKGILVSNEWRTFGLRWTSAEKIIELIGDAGHEERTILNGHVESWPNVSHMSIRLDRTSLLRFHFYEYLLTEKSGSVYINTEEFNSSEEEFCVELLVGLCPKCELYVNLLDENERILKIGNISGEENSVYNGTLIWQSIKLSKNITIDSEEREKSLRLEIQAILTGNKGEGRWAIDNFRMCKPSGQRSKSTILWAAIEPDAICQKLSYNGSTIVNPWSWNKIISNTTDSQKFIDKLIESCGSSCASFGENSLLCNSMGCTCNRGYKGTNCDRMCTDGYHGYNCGEICTPCIIGSCDKITGLCATGLKATLTTQNKATLQWDSSLEMNGLIRNYSISLTGKLIACKGSVAGDIEQIMISQPGNKTTLKISGLRPYAEYTARVIAHTIESGSPRTITFKTSETLIPTSKFSNFSISKDNLTLSWNQPWNCTTITGSTEHAALIFESIESVKKYEEMQQTAGSTFNIAKHLHLTPYTMYRVRLYVIRGYDKLFNSTHYQELTWRTPATSPPRVEKFEVYEADIDTNTISLAWIPPNPAYGEIESYRVTMTQRGRTIVSGNFKVSEERLKCEFREGYVCLRNLQIPATVRRNNIYYMKICAINKGIKRPGREIIFPITAHIFEIKPSKPENLTSTPQSQGITMLNWSRQMFSLTKITEFFINVYQVSTKLKTNKTHEFSTNRSAKENQLNYSVELHLLASTDYVVSIFAVGRRNFTSKESNISISVPGSIAYGNKSDLTVKQYGESIQIQIPAVVNATDNTTVKVCVKGRMTCTYYSDSSTPLTIPEWLAAVYEPEENRTENLTIGANHNHDVPLNCSLHIGETYEIKLVATDLSPDTSSETLSASVTLDMDDDQSAKSNKAWLVGPPILAICLSVLVFTGFRIREMVQRQEPREPSYVEPVPPSSTTIPRQPRPSTYTEVIPLSMARGTNDCTDLHLQESSVSQLEVVKNESSDDLYSLPKEPNSCPVGIEYFERHVKDAAASGLLDSQFMLLPKDLTRPYEYGSLPENMPKNRCKYQIAYDHSRVVLKKIPGDPYSDYINASYIKGYRKNKAYIAAGGPKPNTVNDFWRMVWQEKVRVICMLTDVTKDAETECEKYWPDVGTMVVQGNFHISNIDEQVSANYTLRIFELSHGQNTQQVTHLHYTEWPTLGVPTYRQSLVEYLEKLGQTGVGNDPILVHCSTGDDRTGTVILCDICLRQAITEKVIDVTAVIKLMRDSRANMVGTLQQYVLAHIIITESIVSWSTQIPTDVLLAGIKDLRMRLPHDIQRLNDSKWQEEALKSSATRNLPTAQEEANAKILDLEPDIPEVIYVNVADKHRDHINAVSVDSFKMNEQYLACSLPPPLTLASFWGFIVERDIKLIIIMQCSDPKYPTCIDIMPYESIVIPMLDIQVEDETSLDEREYFTYEKLLLGDTSQDKARSQSVAVLTCKGWGCGRNQKPPPPATLISLWRASEKIPRKKGETLVLCDDGITGCGLYLALSFLLERMTVERECNVISAVRSVRRSKREFVQSLEQSDYLYDAAVNYSERFLTYANLS